MAEEQGYLGTKVRCIKCGWEGTYRECGFGHDDYYCPVCLVESLEKVEKVTAEALRRKTYRGSRR